MADEEDFRQVLQRRASRLAGNATRQQKHQPKEPVQTVVSILNREVHIIQDLQSDHWGGHVW